MKKIHYGIFLILLLSFSCFYGNLNAQLYWNQACAFSGSNSSYISRANSSSLNISGSFTIEMWVNPVNSTVPSPQILLQKRDGASNNGYGLTLFNGKIGIRTNSTTKLVGKTVLPNNVWTHVSGKYDSSTGLFSVSINGILDTSAIVAGAAPIAATDSLYIGKGLNAPFEGKLDEIRIWNEALTYAKIFQFRRLSIGTNTGEYNGLVMSLTFQDNEGDGNPFSLLDWSGMNNNCSNHGVSAVDLSNRPSETININECIDLDGSNDYLSGPDLTAITPQSAFTLEAWIYPRSYGTNHILIHKGSADGTSVNYSLRLHNGFLKGTVNNAVVLNSNDIIPLNQWSHVAFVYDGNDGKNYFFINGKISDVNNNNSAVVVNGSDSLYVGGTPDLDFFNGFIDELRIKLTAKSEEEINRFLFKSIDDVNETAGSELVYNFDGYLVSNAGGTFRLNFRNNSGFSNMCGSDFRPTSPLIRNDESNFSEGYFMKAPNKRIPASGTTGWIYEDTLDITLNGTINDINVFLAINHSRENDLEVKLFGPNGDNVELFNNNFLELYSENVVTLFNDDADSSLVNGKYVCFAPIVKPYQNLNSVFSGDNASGKWRLVIADQSAGDTGRLYGWGIQFNNMTSVPGLLSAKCLIQGFYNPVTDLMAADTMRFILRNIESPYGIVDSSKGVIQSNGSAVVSFNNIQKGDFYYIQLKHRNSVETWSSIPFSFDPLTSQSEYNFTNSLIKAYGNNLVQVDYLPFKFAIYNGDVNQDGVVDATDFGAVDNAAYNFISGYVNTDLTGDNNVDASDAAIADNNSANFVSSVTP